MAETTTVACPPLHAIGVVITAEAKNALGWVTVKVVEPEQPLISVKV